MKFFNNRLQNVVIPFVNQFLSLGGLDHKSIRGLVHKLEESSEIMHAASFYEIGIQSKVYPFQVHCLIKGIWEGCLLAEASDRGGRSRCPRPEVRSRVQVHPHVLCFILPLLFC